MIKTSQPEDVENMSQEEKDKKDGDAKLKKRIKDALKEIESIQPAGLITKNFVIEPIGFQKYIYNVCGKIGITKSEKDTYESKQWFVEIEGIKINIEGRPLNKKEFFFNMPDEDFIKEFVKGKIKAKTAKELYQEARRYYKRFLDLSDEVYYDGLCIGTFQSWLTPMLYSVFFLSIIGEFGGGKSTILESIKNLSRHGVLGQPSEAFIGRGTERLQISLFLDEFDVMGEEDNRLYMVVRTCQRRDQKYIRTDNKGTELGSWETFGMVAFTVHGTIEDALQTRSIIIYTSESNNPNLSRLSHMRHIMGHSLYNEFFIWYIRNIPGIYDDYVTHVTHVTHLVINNNLSDEEFIYSLSPWEEAHEAHESHKGRNAEIESVILTILRFSGLCSNKMDESHDKARYQEMIKKEEAHYQEVINKLLSLKNELREEMREIGLSGILRDFLIYIYGKKKKDPNYRDHQGYFIISNQEIFEGFVNYAKNKGYLYQVKTAEYRGIMRDFGFTKGKNAVRKRVWLESEQDKVPRLAYTFDERVQNTLGIKISPLIINDDRRIDEDEMD